MRAHSFLLLKNTKEYSFRNERVISTMTEMGPAVFNGGLSTLLAFILLATSKSYVFMSFFKIFFLICVFGLYHGLIAMPVFLSMIGKQKQKKAYFKKRVKYWISKVFPSFLYLISNQHCIATVYVSNFIGPKISNSIALNVNG